MKIKDLPPKTNMGGIKVKTNSGRIGYWASQWNKGVWLKDKPEDTRIHPIFIENLEQVLEWEVLDYKSNET